MHSKLAVYLARGEALRHKLMVIRKAGLTVDADVYQLTMPPEAHLMELQRKGQGW